MYKISTIFFLLVTCVGFGQSEELKIPWVNNQKLVWSDFQGNPDDNIPYHANTNSGISFSWSLRTSGESAELKYEVQTSFYPMRSWVKGKGSPELLAHEQLHFDISELYARKLRRELSAYKLGPNVKEDLNRIYQRNEKGRQQMQKLYDLESDHGLKGEAQKRWEEYVKLEFQKVREFL